jgi:hypothetical protein
MSAFMHDNAHVDAIIHGILTYATLGGVRYGNPSRYVADDPTEAGRVLLLENAESMAYRYNMKDIDNPADGGTRPIEYLGYVEQAEGYVYDPRKPRKHYSAGEILLALHSLEYQSCERPEFEQTVAHQLIRSAERALICAMPDYAHAQTWTID